MKHPGATTLSLPILFVLLSGCTLPQRGTPISIRGQAHREALAVDLENLHGGVIVEVDPAAPAPRISLEGAAGADSNAWAAAQIDPGEPGPVLRVIVQPKAGSPPTDVRVTLPAMAGARVRTAGGSIVIRGASGALDAQSGDEVVRGGDVHVSFAQPIDSPVLVRSSGGNVSLEAPFGSRGLLLIKSPTQPAFDGQGQSCVFQSTSAGGWSSDLGPGGFEIRLIADRGSASVRLRR
ncbi:MAG: hypothetical protein DYG92_01700 [Leptolyngbya sp. PLA1]|nr:hypothetical protein [Leptolyngbya sp. PLA1]